MAWTSYQQRSEQLKQQFVSRLALAEPEAAPEAYYDQHELGLLSDADLEQWIARLAAAPPAEQQAEQPPVEQQVDTATPSYSASDSYQIRSLRWLMNNAETVADKELARQRYLETLFGLWRKHVALTGETYYKDLREEIWERYQAMQHQLS